MKCLQLNMLDHGIAKLAIPENTKVYRYMQLAGPEMERAHMPKYFMFIKYVFPKHRLDDVTLSPVGLWKV